MAPGCKHFFLPAPTSVLFPREAINLLLFMKIYYFAVQLYELPLAPIGYQLVTCFKATWTLTFYVCAPLPKTELYSSPDLALSSLLLPPLLHISSVVNFLSFTFEVGYYSTFAAIELGIALAVKRGLFILFGTSFPKSCEVFFVTNLCFLPSWTNRHTER